MAIKTKNIKQIETERQVLYNIATAVNDESKDIKSLSVIIHKELKKVFEAKSFYISLYDTSDKVVSFPYVVDEKNPGKKSDTLRKFDENLITYLIKDGKSLLLNHFQLNRLADENAVQANGSIPKMWLGVPLLKNEVPVGVVAVKSYTHVDAYSEHDMELLEFVAGQITSSFDRQHTQDRLLQSREYYKAISEHSSSMITILDEQGKLSYESPSLKNILGYKKGELGAKKIMQLVHPDDFYRVARFFVATFNEKNIPRKIAFRFKKKNGSWLNLESVVNNLLGDANVRGIVINSHDISDRKAIEDKLQLSHDILECIGTLVIVANSRGNVTHVGSSVKRILGYGPEELEGNGWWALTYDNPEAGINKKEKLMNYAKGTVAMDDKPYERQVKCKDGTSRWILWQDTKGPGDLIIGVGNDITAQKEAMKESVESTKKLRAKNKELDTFVYKASHDLKGPLASTLGLVNVMKQEIQDPLSLKYIDLVKESTVRLDSILMDLLQVTRLKQGALEVAPIDFDHLINEVTKSLHHDPGYKAVHIRLFVEQLKKFYSDRKLITSVLQNLIDNAIKYRNPEERFPYIYISVTDQKDGMKVRIIDNGLGIPKELQQKVFDMFFRGHEKSQGTGLGLYIVSNTIEKLGGRIKMESDEGKGTHFTLFLPSKPAPKDQKKEDPIFVRVKKQS